MARIRSVKPELRTSLVVGTWPRDIRYFWVLLWGYLDDHGHGVDDARLINADCFPLDDDISPEIVNAWLDLMMKTEDTDELTGPVCRYRVSGRRYLHAPNWTEHQRPQHPKDSRIPPCPWHEGNEPFSYRDVLSGDLHEDVMKIAPGTSGDGGATPKADDGSDSPPPRAVAADRRDPHLNPQPEAAFVQATALHEDLMKTSGGVQEALTPEMEMEQGDGAGRGNARKRAAASAAEPPGWSEFWKVYPRKEGKGAAQTAYVRALKKRGVTPKLLLDAALKLREASAGEEERFIAHPTTWLNQDRWEDEPAKRGKRAVRTDGRSVSTDDELSGWER